MNPAIKQLLDQKVKQYNHIDFIEKDPISIPHLFTKQQDIEIAAFFAAIFAWGNRTTIIQKSKELLERMDNAPFEFCTQHQSKDLKKLVGFEMVDRGIPRHDYPVLDANGVVIGKVTSGTQSPSLGKAIGMAYVPSAVAAENSEIFISVRDKSLKAKVVKLPFYKP